MSAFRALSSEQLTDFGRGTIRSETKTINVNFQITVHLLAFSLRTGENILEDVWVSA